MRSLIIHNPKSGFGSDSIFEFERALVHAGDECIFRSLTEDFTAEEATADAEDYDVCVLSGGDGTVTSLLGALKNREVSACVFPSGTANLLSANIGNGPEPSALARACRVGATAKIDLGEMLWKDEKGTPQSKEFGLMSGTGYDAQLMQAALPNKAAMGEAAYFAAAFQNSHPTVLHFAITVDGKTYERDGISCLVANNAMMQGDIQIVPDCRMDDGILDVIVLETQDAAQLIRPILFGLVDKEGKAIGRPHIESFRGRRITVRSSEPIPLEVDGDVVCPSVTEYQARVVPSCCNVIVDSMSPYRPKEAPQPRFDGGGEIAYPMQ
ncbi:MAG: diacylglycerol/lipid kinase family protein [Tractidigestivibacter sp.]|jgi:diacylglycerol kinase family enzyme|uniref:diacylglycerol/lipid kinase family protein n=1 Tax=Tractidigestivibacter sp. TaxID=2847320 RepID=UPI003D91C2A5